MRTCGKIGLGAGFTDLMSFMSQKQQYQSTEGNLSHVALCPECHGTKVRPSGLFPSSLLRPSGSLDDGISALMRAWWIKSLIWAWRCTLPGCFLHDKACWPRESTVAPQGHVWASHIALPRRRPTATRMALSSRIQMQTTCTDGKCVEPVATMGCCNCQQSSLVIWLAVVTKKMVEFCVDDSFIPLSLLVDYYYFFKPSVLMSPRGV